MSNVDVYSFLLRNDLSSIIDLIERKKTTADDVINTQIDTNNSEEVYNIKKYIGSEFKLKNIDRLFVISSL